MAPSHPRNGAPDRDSNGGEGSRGQRRAGDQPQWLPWVQLSISTMLVVLFVVMLAKVREQATSIGELEQKLSTIENSRSQDRTTAMEQQLESMIQRLQSVEKLSDQLRNVDRQQQALKQDLQQLRSIPRPTFEAPGESPSPMPTPLAPNPSRPSTLPGSPRPSATLLRPPTGNF